MPSYEAANRTTILQRPFCAIFAVINNMSDLHQSTKSWTMSAVSGSQTQESAATKAIDAVDESIESAMYAKPMERNPRQRLQINGPFQPHFAINRYIFRFG